MNRTTGWLALLALLLTIGTLLGSCGPQPTSTPAPTTRPTPAVEPTPTTTPLTRYEHPSGLFVISYPEGWSLEEDVEKVGFTSPSGLLKILIQFSDFDLVLDTPGMRRVIDGFFSPNGFGSTPGFQRGDETIQEDGSILVEYSFQSDGRQARAGTFFEQHGTIVYFLSFWALDEAQWDPNLSLFSTVANSFEVLRAPAEATAGWNVLTSQAWGIEIAYPPGWEASELEDGVGISKDEETFLRIWVTTDLPSGDPAEAERQIVESEIAALRNEDPQAQVSGPDTLVLGGEEAVYADFVYVDPGSGLQNNGTVIGVVHDGRAYEFLIFTLTADAEENIPLFTEVLMSFRFLQ